MERRLNLSVVREAMTQAGLNAAQLAKQLAVSREAVSKWLNDESQPKPDKLLQLALALGLRYDQLVLGRPESMQPVVAFRRKGAHKITADYIRQARTKGELLRPLVPYLPFDKVLAPETLKQHDNDHGLLQQIALELRKKMGIGNDAPIGIADLVKLLKSHQAVIIPVLWGARDQHENALHIFLPDTKTTWIYLNLDSPEQHFKFWMAHELGHVLTPTLTGDPAEDFADAFAATLLFPDTLAGPTYARLRRMNNGGLQMNHIKDCAVAHGISPFTVYEQLKAYARATGESPILLEPAIYGADKNMVKEQAAIRDRLFSTTPIPPEEFIQRSEEVFETPFYDALRQYVAASDRPASFLQQLLDIPLVDAKSLRAALR